MTVRLINNAVLLISVLLSLAIALVRAQDATQLYKKAAPAVISLEAVDLNGDVMWSGTGFFISADGQIITNFHVIDHAPRLRFRSQDHAEQYITIVLATDRGKDLALLKGDVDQMPFLQLGCNKRPEIGSTVFTIGNPLGVLDNTFSQGIISGVREVGTRTLLQTSAPISHGNSGGPLLDVDGKVVGITTATMGDGQNLNFAVPADDVCKVVSGAGSPKALSSLFDTAPSTVQPPAANDSPTKHSSAIDPRWLSSDARSVLADPHFYDLEIPQRESILSEIDPQFRNFSPEKRKAYLWAAETNNLPKPLESLEIYSWTAGSPNCKAELSESGVTKILESEHFQIKASFPDNSMVGTAFLEAHIRIVNKSVAPVELVPQTFSVRVVKPKPHLLRFEYPNRVGSETFIRTIQGQAALNVQLPTELYKMIFAIPTKAMKEEMLQPGEAVEGEVYFEHPEKRPRDFVLNLFFGHDEYQIPFNAPK